MKRIVILLAALLFGSSAYAQSGSLNDEVKGFQWGIQYKQEVFGYDGFFFQASANVSMGYRFDRRNYLGCQTGYAFKAFLSGIGGPDPYNAIPLLADYIHYCPIGKMKKNSFIWGAEAGAIFTLYRTDTAPVYDETLPFIGLKAGVDFSVADVAHLMLALRANYLGPGVSIGFTF